MCEQYRTKGRSCFSSLNVHERQNCTMCNNKSVVPEFPRYSMIVSLYVSSILYKYSFMFYSQSMIVKPYTNLNATKNDMSFVSLWIILGDNIIIDRILVYLNL